MTDKEQLAYFAGLFDGEGCIYISRQKQGKYTTHILKARIYNLDLRPLRMAKRLYDGTLSFARKEDYRNQWYWEVGARKAVKFLKDILPYSIIKKDEIEVGLEFQKANSELHKSSYRCVIHNKRIREAYRKDISELKRVAYLM